MGVLVVCPNVQGKHLLLCYSIKIENHTVRAAPAPSAKTTLHPHTYPALPNSSTQFAHTPQFTHTDPYQPPTCTNRYKMYQTNPAQPKTTQTQTLQYPPRLPIFPHSLPFHPSSKHLRIDHHRIQSNFNPHILLSCITTL